MGSKGFTAAAVLLLILITQLGAVEKDLAAKDVWNVKIFPLVDHNLPPEYTYLLNSIPFSLKDALEDLKTHIFKDDERNKWLEKKRERRIAEAKKELSGLYHRRDLLFFTGTVSDEKLNELNLRIENKKNKIFQIEQEGSGDAGEPPAVNVVFVEKRITSEEIPDLRDIDQAVYGKLEIIDRWLYLSINVYNYSAKEEREVFRELVDPENISKTTADAAIELSREVSGRNPPVLLVTGIPKDSFFTLEDDSRTCLSDAPVTDLNPGVYTLTVHKRGYMDEKREIVLKSGERTEVTYTLTKEKTGFAVINTFPSGADLYIDSVWMGRTPFLLKDPVYPSYIQVVKEDYSERSYMLDNEEADKNINLILSPAKLDKDRIQERRRKTFYNSLGAFIVSIAVPAISYGLSSDYGYAYNSSIISAGVSSNESDRLMNASSSWYNIYLGGIFISASLFIDMAIKLENYISFY